jgi:hypothetical protein
MLEQDSLMNHESPVYKETHNRVITLLRSLLSLCILGIFHTDVDGGFDPSSSDSSLSNVMSSFTLKYFVLLQT